MKNIFILTHYLEKHDATKLMIEGKQYFSNVEALQSFFLAKTANGKRNQLVLFSQKIFFLG